MRSIKKNIKPLLLIATMLISVQHNVALASNRMQDVINNVFGNPDYSNSTNASSYETQRAHVFSGGSYMERNKIVNTQLAGFDPFYINAGCGGIDIYSGALSFINADEFVHLLESIMQNAKGYAFNIALETLCPQCMASINNLQSKIQKLAQANINSCEAAQGIVNDVASSFAQKKLITANTEAVIAGDTEKDYQAVKKAGRSVIDTFSKAMQGWRGEKSNLNSSNPAVAQKAKDAQKKAIQKAGGALTYVAIADTKPETWFALGDVTMPIDKKTTNASGETVTQQVKEKLEGTVTTRDMAELILSFVGSLVVGEPKEVANGNNGNDIGHKEVELKGMLVTLKDMVEGNNTPIKIYDCSRNTAPEGLDICTITPRDVKEVRITGYMVLLQRALYAFIDNLADDTEPTDKVKSWLGSLPNLTVLNLQNIMIQTKSKAQVKDYVAKTIKNISYLSMKNMLDDVFSNTLTSVSIAENNDPLQKKNREIIERAQQAMLEEFRTHWNPHYDPDVVYNSLMKKVGSQK